MGSSERRVGVSGQLNKVDCTWIYMLAGNIQGSGKSPNTTALPGLEAGEDDTGHQTPKNVECVQGWMC